MTDEQDKLIFLDNCLDDDFCTDRHFALLKALSHDADPYIRSQVACVAVNFVCEGAKELLLQLANDDDTLVRAEACDSLSCFPCDEVEAFLRDALVEEYDPLARSYAILSWADVRAALCLPADDGLVTARKWQQREKNVHCRLSLCYARHCFGDENAWQDMLTFLKHEDYHLRCAALSLLGEIEDKPHQEAIETAWQDMLTFLKHEDYHLRCAALSLLGEIEDKPHQEAIETAVSEMLLTETNKAVLSTAERTFPHLH